MTNDSLKLVSIQDTPQPARAIDTFAFVRDGDTFIAVHNGKLIPAPEAVTALAEIIRAYLNRKTFAALQPDEVAVNVALSTPGGLG